jgi:hypothetical protein
MAALAFAYLVTVQGLTMRLAREEPSAKALPADLPVEAGGSEEGGEK